MWPAKPDPGRGESKRVQIHHGARSEDLFAPEILSIKFRSYESLFLFREANKFERMSARQGLQALKKAGEQCRAAPVIGHSLSVSPEIEMRANDNDRIGDARQRAFQIGYVLPFYRPVRQALPETPRLYEEFSETRVTLDARRGKGGQALLDKRARQCIDIGLPGRRNSRLQKKEDKEA